MTFEGAIWAISFGFPKPLVIELYFLTNNYGVTFSTIIGSVGSVVIFLSGAQRFQGMLSWEKKFKTWSLLRIKARVNYHNIRRVPSSWRYGDSMLWVSV